MAYQQKVKKKWSADFAVKRCRFLVYLLKFNKINNSLINFSKYQLKVIFLQTL